MLFLGLVWAALAPLIITMGVAVTSWWLTKYLEKDRAKRLGICALVLIVIWSVIGVQYVLQFQDFKEHIRKIEKIHPSQKWQIEHANRANLQGGEPVKVVLNSQTANSFGYRYVREGFVVQMRQYPTTQQWIEVGKSREALGHPQVEEKKIQEPDAQWIIEENFESGQYWGTQWIRIKQGDELIAQDAISQFHPKGVAKWALGVWGLTSEPDVVSDSQAWRKSYYLACWVLLNKTLDACAR